ncbi:hypothetical protein J5834_01960 [bacterium]|nr:hypothetical protein [bacterium]
MKFRLRLIIGAAVLVFLSLLIFVLSFSGYSEDHACIIFANVDRKPDFGEINLGDYDDTEFCNRSNTLILHRIFTKHEKPLETAAGAVSILIDSVVPDKKQDEPVFDTTVEKEEPEPENQTVYERNIKKNHDITVIGVIGDRADFTDEELDEAALRVQSEFPGPGIIVTRGYAIPDSAVTAVNKLRVRFSDKPEIIMSVFSVIHLEDGSKKLIFRSISRRYAYEFSMKQAGEAPDGDAL